VSLISWLVILLAPILTLAQTAEDGRVIFERLQKKYPVVRQPELWALATPTPKLTLWLPEQVWNELSTRDRQSLGLFLKSQTANVRAAPERYVDIPSAAPVYKAFRNKAAVLCDNCWAIGVGRVMAKDVSADRIVLEGQ
jgi:hypothetical protein